MGTPEFKQVMIDHYENGIPLPQYPDVPYDFYQNGLAAGQETGQTEGFIPSFDVTPGQSSPASEETPESLQQAGG